MEAGQFHNKLKMYRHCTGYSQKKVAKMLRLSDTSALSRWEHGKACPSIIQVFRLAHLYRVLPHELYDDLWEKHAAEIGLLTPDQGSFIPNHSSIL